MFPFPFFNQQVKAPYSQTCTLQFEQQTTIYIKYKFKMKSNSNCLILFSHQLDALNLRNCKTCLTVKMKVYKISNHNLVCIFLSEPTKKHYYSYFSH